MKNQDKSLRKENSILFSFGVLIPFKKDFYVIDNIRSVRYDSVRLGSAFNSRGYRMSDTRDL